MNKKDNYNINPNGNTKFKTFQQSMIDRDSKLSEDELKRRIELRAKARLRLCETLCNHLGGETLTTLRIKAGYSMRDFAKALNEDFNIVRQYGNKDFKINNNTINKITILLQVDKKTLLDAINYEMNYVNSFQGN